MKQVKLDKVKKILSLIFLILWCFLIFYFSNQSGSVSSHSSGLIVKMVRIIIPTGNIELLTFIIRKLAHIFLYFMLTILTYNCFRQFNFKKKYLIILFCLFQCIIHQKAKASSAFAKNFDNNAFRKNPSASLKNPSSKSAKKLSLF